jgi:hypothetical protein
MALIAVIGATVGILREVPGLAIFSLIVVLPPEAFTEIRVRRQQRRGDPMSG